MKNNYFDIGFGPNTIYALVKIDKNVDFIAIFRKIHSEGFCLKCQAIKGEYQIIVMIEAETYEDCLEICDNYKKTYQGITDIKIMKISLAYMEEHYLNKQTGEAPLTSDDATTKNSEVMSYVFADIDSTQLDKILTEITSHENILIYYYSESASTLILLVSGNQFTDIDKFIRYKVSSLDGILKVKEYPVIDIYEYK
ncbi:MAG: Response regulatory protein [Ignavibacteria bacterium]|nr:Response regulatory protein [Ignavibacteria bacterium]